jgi:YVTN family beta-propeller protein
MTRTGTFRWLGSVAAAVVLTIPLLSAAGQVRIIQTNSAGDRVSLIDPATNKVVGEIKDIEANHGAAASPDGTRIYISNESMSTLDVADVKTLKVIKRIPLSGHPNNISISRDGRRVYVGIIQAPGGVDVSDTASFQMVKTIPTKGSIHNTYVTPDGNTSAGSIQGKTINVIDAKTEEPCGRWNSTWAFVRWPSQQIPMGRPNGFSRN